MQNGFSTKVICVFVFFVTMFYSGCYNPLFQLQNIELIQNDMIPAQNAQTQNLTYVHNTNNDEALIFYKECSRNGNAWLFECQSVGLESIQQAVYLYYPNVLLNHIIMYFYPQKTYIRFELHDSSLLQSKPQ